MSKSKTFRIKTCVICGKQFIPFGNEKCCNDECKKKNLSNKYKEFIQKQKDTITIRFCKICNKEFETDEYHNRTTCSKGCHDIAVSMGNYKPAYTYVNKLIEIEANARLSGLRYADIQKQKTLALAGKIDVNI